MKVVQMPITDTWPLPLWRFLSRRADDPGGRKGSAVRAAPLDTFDPVIAERLLPVRTVMYGNPPGKQHRWPFAAT